MWASMNEGSKWEYTWNESRNAQGWRFDLHCGIDDTGSPGIVGIVCDYVLRQPSEHGNCSMGKHLLAKAHITKINQLTQTEVTELICSTVNETGLAILKRQGSRGITIVCMQRKITFDI
jgi:hypothetical protein